MGRFLDFSEILFAIFLIPTKYTTLCQNLSLPQVLNPVFLLFCFILAHIIITFLRTRKIPPIPKTLFFPYLGLLMLMVLSMRYTSNLGYGKTKILEFITFTALAYFAPFFIFTSLKVFERFLKTLIIIGVFLSIAILGLRLYSLFYLSSSEIYPEQGLIGSNYLVLQQIVGITDLIILYYFLLKNHSTKQTIWLNLSYILCIVILVSSYGKCPVFAFFGTIIFMTIISIKNLLGNRRILFNTLLLIIVSSLLFFSIGQVCFLRTKAYLSPNYSGRVERLENARVAIKLFSQHPFLGVGIGGFSNFSVEIKGIERFKYPHNIILEIGSELGLIGIIFFGLMIGFSFKHLIYLRNKYNYLKLWLLPNVIMSLFVFSFLTSMTSGDINNLALFAWMGTSYTLGQILNKVENEK
ncbi:MAG: O-antigen ligase family protein [bacterium]|nr:O-antigen ligase family protein [bacterium]